MKQTERERQQFPGGTCTEGRWSVLYVGLVQYTLSFTPDLQKLGHAIGLNCSCILVCTSWR